MIATTTSSPGSTNGYHTHQSRHSHLAANHLPQHHLNMHQLQGAGATFLTDHNGFIHQIPNSSLLAAVTATGASPGAVAATANGLLAPQQRTDRLPVS